MSAIKSLPKVGVQHVQYDEEDMEEVLRNELGVLAELGFQGIARPPNLTPGEYRAMLARERALQRAARNRGAAVPPLDPRLNYEVPAEQSAGRTDFDSSTDGPYAYDSEVVLPGYSTLWCWPADAVILLRRVHEYAIRQAAPHSAAWALSENQARQLLTQILKEDPGPLRLYVVDGEAPN